MLNWIAAIAAGIVVAWIAYGRARNAVSPSILGLAFLRALAVAIVAALLFGAPLAPPSPAPPILAVDASASLRRTHDSAAMRSALAEQARRTVQDVGADQVIVFGESLREGDASLIDDIAFADLRSSVRPVVDRASALGRPLVLLTDGEFDDSDAFADAPAGSRVVIDTTLEREDAAIADLQVPVSAAAGDTLRADIGITSGAAGSPGGVVRLLLDGRVVATAPFAPLEPHATARLAIPLPLPRVQGALLLQAALSPVRDHEVRNDTLATVVEITDKPPVVFVSTSPDVDVREVLRVLRGTFQLPVRAYLRLAPQLWREEGTFAGVSEADVRARAQRAGLVVLHGDTTWGDVRLSSRGARALWAPAPPLPAARAGEVQRAEEWYPTGAPPSPLAAALAGLPWDTLPPIALAAPARGSMPLLEVRLGRAGDPVAAIAAREADGVRTVVISGSGYSGWALRGGRPAEAFTALWGALFDWLAAARGDERAARPLMAQVRTGEPVRWRRGGADSTVQVVLARRGAPVVGDTVVLEFGGALETSSAPLAQGVYDVQAAGGASVLVVNAAREWLPRKRSLDPAARIAGAVTSDAPRLADKGWPFVLALLLLCAEWIGRRFAGFR